MIKGFGSLELLMSYTSGYSGEVYRQGQGAFIFVTYDEYVKGNAVSLYMYDVDSLLCADISDEEKQSLLRFVGNLPRHLDDVDFLITTPGEKEMYLKIKNILESEKVYEK